MITKLKLGLAKATTYTLANWDKRSKVRQNLGESQDFLF